MPARSGDLLDWKRSLQGASKDIHTQTVRVPDTVIFAEILPSGSRPAINPCPGLDLFNRNLIVPAMANNTPRQRVYDHRLHLLVWDSGNPHPFPELKIPRSTPASRDPLQHLDAHHLEGEEHGARCRCQPHHQSPMTRP